MIDLTHAIPRQDVVRGAIVLSRATPFMPADAVYCAVVDPGVGSERRAIAVRSASGALLVGPDNGRPVACLDGARWRAGRVRDRRRRLSCSIRCPTRSTAATSSRRQRRIWPTAWTLDVVGPPLDLETLQVLELAGPMVAPGAIGARVVGVDGFGNVQLNVTEGHLRAAGFGEHVHMGGAALPFVSIFAELPDHGLGVIVDSQGYLALVVNNGSAAEALNVHEGSAIVLEAGDDAAMGPRHLQPVD